MASTQRVKLLAQGLVECGLDVSVLCTQVTERPPLIENKEVKGVYKGINYEYTTGRTIRSNYFLIRRWYELRGILLAIRRLAELKRKKKLCCVYYYGNILVNEPVRWIFYSIVRLLNLPLVIEVGERPWPLVKGSKKRLITLSPFLGIQGVVVISDFLKNWAEQEKIRMKKDMAILELPILVDLKKQRLTDFHPEKPYVLFAGSSAYDQTIQFILAAMTSVWNTHPECLLVITGCRPGEPASEAIIKFVNKQNLEGRVELAGYLSRLDLLQRYSQATALLLPLFDDDRSKARFPTKLGEYSASGRPIVTNNVGDVARYFIDKKNAYVCTPGSSSLYGQKIDEVLNNPEESIRIGLEGRRTAERYFHYSLHAQSFANFIKSLA